MSNWRLEVRIFVSGTKRIHNEDSVETLYNHRDALKRNGVSRGSPWSCGFTSHLDVKKVISETFPQANVLAW